LFINDSTEKVFSKITFYGKKPSTEDIFSKIIKVKSLSYDGGEAM